MLEMGRMRAALRARCGIIIGMKFNAIIHEAEEGGYWAEVPELPGCYTQGETLDETKANVIEAAECWLEAQLPVAMTFSPVRRIRRRPAAREAVLA